MRGRALASEWDKRGGGRGIARDDRRYRGPGKTAGGGVPPEPAFVARAVRGGALVEHDRIVPEGKRAVGKAGWNPDNSVIAAGQLDGGVIAQRRRAVPHIHHHINHGTVDAPHQLSHRRVPLKMQAAHRANRGRQGMVVLHEFHGDACLGQHAAAVGFGKKPAVVAKAARGDQLDARQRGVVDLQGTPRKNRHIQPVDRI